MKRLLIVTLVLALATVSLVPAALAQQPASQPHQPRVLGYAPVIITPGGVYPYPYYGWGSGGYPYYPYSYRSYYDPYYYGPYYPAPVTIPAETLYGPAPIQRLMGVDHWFRPGGNVTSGSSRTPRAVARPPADARAAPLAAPRAAKPGAAPRGTNAEAIGLAWKYIGYGDAHFALEKFSDAGERYRKAARTSPQMADAWFRQGFAQTAMKRYDLAVAAIRRGLELKADWPRSNFRLAELFGGNDQVKTAYLEALVKAAEEQPNNADLQFLAGVHLHFDGKADRAAAFFKRAAEMAPGDKAFVKAFLGNAEG